MVVAQPNIPVKPMTLYVNKAGINGDLHANATWGASQAGIARAVTEALLDGTLPAEAEDEWAIITANWVNPACDDLDAVYLNNYNACRTAIRAALKLASPDAHSWPTWQGRLPIPSTPPTPEVVAMQYIRLGNSGLKVSKLCLGTMNMGTPDWKPWIFDEQRSEPIVKHALDAGVNFIDLADFYSAGVGEEVLGRILNRLVRREDIVVTTKVGYGTRPGINASGHSRKHIMDSIDASLTRLGMDYVDLYMLHFYDLNSPVEEVMATLNDIVKAGKARYIGVSTMLTGQLAKILMACERNGWVKPINMQLQAQLCLSRGRARDDPILS